MLQATTVAFTATQVGDLSGTGLPLTAAPTTGVVQVPVMAIFMLDYGGTAAWGATGGGDLCIAAATGPVVYMTVDATALIEVSADTYWIAHAQSDDATATIGNFNPTATQESTLNLYNDGTDYTTESLATATVLRVKLFYYNLTLDISS